MNENFDFNPKHLPVITDKPTNANKLNDFGNKEENKEAMDQLSKKLEVLTLVPKKKYPYPMTSSQEIGWDTDKLFKAHVPKYHFNIKQQDETNYAVQFITSNHISPFASVKPVVVEQKK